MKTTPYHPHLQVTMPQHVLLLLRKDVYHRRIMEACGVLLGERDDTGNWHVRDIQPLQNTTESAVYFEFAPEELLEVELTYPDQIIGVYHSHPTGYPQASKTDQQNMQRVNLDEDIPWVWLILCGPFIESTLQDTETGNILAYYHDITIGLQRVTMHLESSSQLDSSDDQGTH
jgi:proteasome lid subunit RPN8/RPN11